MKVRSSKKKSNGSSTIPPKLEATSPRKDEPAAEWEDPRNLKPWAKNPKDIEPDDVREMARTIRRFGYQDPIIARRENKEIIKGHLRHAAAIHLKMPKVPVRYVDCSEEEAHAMAVADTKISHKRKFNKDKLTLAVEELDAKGIDLTHGTWFGEEEIAKLLKADEVRLPVAEHSPVTLTARYIVHVECESETHQVNLISRLEAEGFSVKAMVS